MMPSISKELNCIFVLTCVPKLEHPLAQNPFQQTTQTVPKYVAFVYCPLRSIIKCGFHETKGPIHYAFILTFDGALKMRMLRLE